MLISIAMVQQSFKQVLLLAYGTNHPKLQPASRVNFCTGICFASACVCALQEYMAGGDLKSMVMEAMTRPFDPPYSKAHAFTWAMQVNQLSTPLAALADVVCVCLGMLMCSCCGGGWGYG